MIEHVSIKNIREGSWTGAMKVEIVLNPDIELTPGRMVEIENEIKAYKGQVKILETYVPKTFPPAQATGILAWAWTQFNSLFRVHIVTHEQRTQAWFRYAHWLTIKTTPDAFTGILANEYHVMFLAKHVKDFPQLTFMGETLIYAVAHAEVDVSEFVSKLGQDPLNFWRILSPQKMIISETVL